MLHAKNLKKENIPNILAVSLGIVYSVRNTINVSNLTQGNPGRDNGHKKRNQGFINDLEAKIEKKICIIAVEVKS